MNFLRFASLALGTIVFLASCKKDKDIHAPVDLTPEDYIYYSSNDTLYRVKASGGNPEMLFNGTDDANGDFKENEIDDIAVDPVSGKLIFLTASISAQSDVVYSGNRDGSGNLTQAAVAKVNGTFNNSNDEISFYGMTATNGKVYLECNDSFIGVVNVDGTGATKLHENIVEDNGNWLYYDLIVDPITNNLYSLGDTAIWKVNLTPNSTLTKVASNNTTDDTFNGYRMAFRKTTEELFFIDDEENDIYKTKTNGTAYTMVHSLNGSAWTIAVDENNGDLYSNELNTIFRIKADGSKLALRTVLDLGALTYY